jgi:hypothetical protein
MVTTHLAYLPVSVVLCLRTHLEASYFLTMSDSNQDYFLSPDWDNKTVTLTNVASGTLLDLCGGHSRWRLC